MKKQKKQHNHKKQTKKINLKSPAKNPIIYSKNILWVIGIIIITTIAYYPTFKNSFTNWDDTEYVVENPYIRSLSGENIKFFFTEPYMGNYHPLTMISLNLDFQIDKLNFNVYVLVNVLLHLMNTAFVFWLVYLLFCKRGDNKSIVIPIIAAALFGVHSLHVESVAWVSERKDVLYSLFFIASLISYTQFAKYRFKNENSTTDQNSDAVEQSKSGYRFYFIAILLFIFSVLSKGMAVALSATVIAIDYLIGRNLLNRKVILEKIPFLAISIIFGIIAINAQKSGHDTATATSFGLMERILFACYGFVQYIIKLIAPMNLSAFYPYPEISNGAIPSTYWFYPLVLLAVVVIFIKSLKKRRHIAFVIMFFVINIILVLQIIPVGNAIMADRYSYIPSIGFFILIGIGYKELIERRNNLKQTLSFIMVAYIILLTVLTQNRCGIWTDSFTLWNDVIQKHNNVKIAWNNRGIARSDSEEYQTAVADFSQAIKLDSNYYEVYNNRGHAWRMMGKFNPAFADFSKALQIKPDYTMAIINKGLVYHNKKKYLNAIDEFNNAIKINPDAADAFRYRGLVKKDMNQLEEAMEDFDKAIEIDHEFSLAYSNRGYIKLMQKDYEAALLDYNKSINIYPEYANAYFNRAIAKFNMGQTDGGCEDLKKASGLGYERAQKEYQKYCGEL